MRITFNRTLSKGLFGAVSFGITSQLILEQSESDSLRKSGVWKKRAFKSSLSHVVLRQGISIEDLFNGIKMEFDNVVEPEVLKSEILEYVENQVSSLLGVAEIYESGKEESITISSASQE